MSRLKGVLAAPGGGLLVESVRKVVDLEAELGVRLQPIGVAGGDVGRYSRGHVEEVAVPSGGPAVYFPVVSGVPVMLETETLGSEPSDSQTEVNRDAFREAYEEMDYYDGAAGLALGELASSAEYRHLDMIRARTGSTFPSPDSTWLDASFDLLAQRDAYSSLGSLEGLRVLQAGGKGLHAVKFLLAGASHAVLLTPMVGEAVFGMALAAELGVKERFDAVVGIAERAPFVDDSFDRIYSGGSAHHFVERLAGPEMHRCLNRGGVFAAIDPVRAPLYGVGTKILGKRERGVFCRPMDESRLGELGSAFDDAEWSRYGAFYRYLLLAVAKAGVRVPAGAMLKVSEWSEMAVAASRLGRFGSSCSFVARKV
jgi:SAM-dependent methyltransferase